MKIHIISIFPGIFESFVNTSLIKKAQDKGLLSFSFHDPRDYTATRHHQVDDTVYGWWEWLLIMAEPVIDCINQLITSIPKWETREILYPAPSKIIFNQNIALEYAVYDNLIFICWRYEWIDARVERYLNDNYPDKLHKISLWQFVVFGWETPTMVMIEAITRMVPWCIQQIPAEESYDPNHNLENIEYPQFTKPVEIFGYKVPDTLISWHHAKIQERKNNNMSSIKSDI